jgi:hypothetical protein
MYIVVAKDVKKEKEIPDDLGGGSEHSRQNQTSVTDHVPL